MLKNLIIVGVGGGVGSALRYLLQETLHKQIENFEPYGTFVVNIIGCLLLGLLAGYAEQERLINTSMNLLLISGFCGGFTTFSTFAHQGNALFISSKPIQAILYIGLSVIIGLLAAYFGYRLTKA
ncbi:fluoride efflux transporter CrcB [Roseivirga sp. E12]|uniref:fluoride efflux transporter CrcB n=1 Tax=Roseivirga sp. E12 TaxID=2819237 RepID=UPI001ABCD379|nr:fluoride efflux transporter CrcB [Roseivirga sp. E12]MBO3700715.1 fluoride efflux transporter CrcB [Roseivirga sp. E12]